VQSNERVSEIIDKRYNALEIASSRRHKSDNVNKMQRQTAYLANVLRSCNSTTGAHRGSEAESYFTYQVMKVSRR
jgi:hypothetical protein